MMVINKKKRDLFIKQLNEMDKELSEYKPKDYKERLLVDRSIDRIDELISDMKLY